MRPHSLILGLLAAVALVGPLAGTGRAQEPTRIRIGSPTAPAMSRESTSSDLVMTLSAGTELEVLGRENDWFWVVLPADGYGTSRAGWVHAGNVDGAVLRRAPKVKEDRAARAEQRAAAKAARKAEKASAMAARNAEKAALRSARDEAAAARRTAKANAKAAQVAAREAKKAEADERRVRRAAEELEKARRDYERLSSSTRD